MTRLRRMRVWVAGVGAVVAFLVPSGVAIGQLLGREDPTQTGAGCAELTARAMDFARHYAVAARQYAAPGPATGLPRLASSEEIRRCGNPEKLIERIVPRAAATPAVSTKTTP